MSVFCIAFLLPNLISFEKLSTLTFEKLKLCGSNSFRDFIIAFKAE